MPGVKILVVDDEQDILDLLNVNLSRERFIVRCVSSGESALQLVSDWLPDLVLLDLMLPGLDGLEVCRRIKQNPQTEHIAVIMLTAKGEELDVVTGLQLGASDYIAKPFSVRILLARIRAVLRTHHVVKDEPDQQVIKRFDLHIDPGKHKVTLANETLNLTFTEFKLLQFLASKPGWVYSRYQIIDALRGENYAVTPRSVDVQIVSLRKKLKHAAVYIETVANVGYRFKEK